MTVTPTHPLFVQNGPWIAMRPANKIYIGQNIAVTKGAGLLRAGRDHGRQRGLDWDTVVSIEEVDSPEPFVYDLEVEGTHIFVANGILTHNSQMLRYMSELAPRGIYASGKTSSAAGLCVAPDSMIEVDGEAGRDRGVRRVQDDLAEGNRERGMAAGGPRQRRKTASG